LRELFDLVDFEEVFSSGQLGDLDGFQELVGPPALGLDAVAIEDKLIFPDEFF
jgi:hypothetical protein